MTVGRAMWGCLVLVVYVVWSVGGVGVAEELPEAMQADLYRLEARTALEAKDPQRAIRALEKFETVTNESRWEFLYLYGTLLAKYGTTAEKISKGQALLVKAAKKIGEGEKYYKAALTHYSAASARLSGMKEQEKKAEAAHARQATLKELGETFQMVRVQGGTFRMGCTAEQEYCRDDEEPVHRVRVSDFEIGRYEVTQAVWEVVMGENPSRFEGCSQCPVERVSWEDVQVFLERLNDRLGAEYRLPTEAEWEYAARGGGKSKGYQYAGSNTLGAVARYRKNRRIIIGRIVGTTHPVGEKRPNELGLYDMSGNVWEWVADCWNENYRGAPSDGGAWERGDCSRRVLRGGHWYNGPRELRSANRTRYTVGDRSYKYGFRLARTLTP